MLFVYSKLYPGKHTLCPGCCEGVINLLTFFAAESLRNNPQGIATFYQGLKILSEKNKRTIEHMLDHGFNIYSINATGCDQVSELVNPFNTRMYPSGHYGFGTASAAALGAKFSLDQAYQNRYNSVLTKIIVFAGDGAIYDIGNGPFNHALGENFDITWVVFNNEGYMNTGMQKSGATRFGTDRSTSPIGKKYAGKTTLHRRIISQAMAISHVYAAKLTIDNPFYAIKILKEAIAYNGPSLVEFFSTCPTGHVTQRLGRAADLPDDGGVPEMAGGGAAALPAHRHLGQPRPGPDLSHGGQILQAGHQAGRRHLLRRGLHAGPVQPAHQDGEERRHPRDRPDQRDRQPLPVAAEPVHGGLPGQHALGRGSGAHRGGTVSADA